MRILYGVEILEGTQMKIALLLAVLSVSLASLPAHAQATRTWVSGVGDDANPCSRTAPCKTFAGAISKTAAGGEINCLDPGGFGAVTITKSITIDVEGSIGGRAGVRARPASSSTRAAATLSCCAASISKARQQRSQG